MSEQKVDDVAAASNTLNSDTNAQLSNASHSSNNNNNKNGSSNAASGAAAANHAPTTPDDDGEGYPESVADTADGSPNDSGSGEPGSGAPHGDHPLMEEDGAAEEESEEEQDATELDTVAANDVKNIILQVLSPYFDDDAGGAGDVAGVDALGIAANAAGASPSGSPNTANKEMGGMPTPSGASPASSPHGHDEDAGEDVAQRYDHAKAEIWIARICDGIMERLVGLGKPFKFVVHTMVMRKCGAGLHVCSSCYYAPSDGWLSHSHDLSAHLYAVVTVYWCAM